MPAKSKAQQRAAGIALAAKRGEMEVSELEGAAKEMYDSMSEDELEDFAETEHTGLPDKKEGIIKLKDLIETLEDDSKVINESATIKSDFRFNVPSEMDKAFMKSDHLNTNVRNENQLAKKLAGRFLEIVNKYLSEEDKQRINWNKDVWVKLNIDINLR